MVAALFVRKDSVYKTMPNVDAWDMDRDARNWPGGNPIVAHPPCRGWGGLSHMANATEEEKELAVWSIAQIRKYGGVLEHPKKSKLWPHLSLPKPGKGFDQYGGWTLGVAQQWWGRKRVAILEKDVNFLNEDHIA